MRPFSYARVRTPGAALAATARHAGATYIAGGTNILDLMKDTVETPPVLVDINALPYGEIVAYPTFLRIGSLARMSDTADHADVRRVAPALSQALLASASPQLRNAASIGGNLMQRTRCAYFRDVANACNKRRPGAGCAALAGVNRQHAILGTSERCICVHPSDFAVALLVTDALVRTAGASGERAIPIASFHTLPSAAPNVETVLHRGELIVAVDVPATRLAAASRYVKVRDRASYEFALVSVAAALDVRDGTIADARLGLGGVAPVPWRARDAERSLIGAPANVAAFERAAEIALRGARGFGQNDFKIPLVKRTIVKTLAAVAA